MWTILSQAWWHRPGMPAPQEAEEGGSKAQGLPELQSEFKASMGNLVKPCLKFKSTRWMEIQFSGRILAQHAEGPGFSAKQAKGEKTKTKTWKILKAVISIYGWLNKQASLALTKYVYGCALFAFLIHLLSLNFTSGNPLQTHICLFVYGHTLQCECGGQRTTRGNRFSPTAWVLRIGLR